MPPVRIDRVIAGVGESPVEALLAFREGGLELFWSGGSAVLGVDAVGGSPHGDISDEPDVQVYSPRRPHELGAVVAGSLTSNLISQTGDQLGPLSQIYELIRSGRLQTVTERCARLIPAAAIEAYVSLLTIEAKAATGGDAA